MPSGTTGSPRTPYVVIDIYCMYIYQSRGPIAMQPGKHLHITHGLVCRFFYPFYYQIPCPRLPNPFFFLFLFFELQFISSYRNIPGELSIFSLFRAGKVTRLYFSHGLANRGCTRNIAARIEKNETGNVASSIQLQRHEFFFFFLLIFLKTIFAPCFLVESIFFFLCLFEL